MIKANELKVGSWINQLVRTDCGIHSAPFCCSEDFLEVLFASRDYENYDPIPLTPEILEKCGFEYYAWADFLQFTHFIKDDFILRQTDSQYSFFNTSKCDNSERQHLTIIRYLHQLQNLYFALTGEELTLNHKAFSPLT